MSHTMHLPTLATATLIALAALAGAAHAESSASSAASNSVSASLGSFSNSSNASSEASSPGQPMKAGVYRVIEMAAAPGREGYAQLTLRTEDSAAGSASRQTPAQDTLLFLPLATVANAALAVGQVIQAHARPYGLELARQGAAGERASESFFLIVADEVYRELQTRVVRL